MISKTVEKLAAYMKFRAAREGVGSTLDEAFFANAINMGTLTFFGVTVDPERRQLVVDKQKAFAAWNAQESFLKAHPLVLEAAD
jgi:hypothetical protein